MWSSHRHWIKYLTWLFISNGNGDILPLLICMANAMWRTRTTFEPFSLNTVCLRRIFFLKNIIINPNNTYYSNIYKRKCCIKDGYENNELIIIQRKLLRTSMIFFVTKEFVLVMCIQMKNYVNICEIISTDITFRWDKLWWP
jgi:hypothetical protein